MHSAKHPALHDSSQPDYNSSLFGHRPLAACFLVNYYSAFPVVYFLLLCYWLCSLSEVDFKISSGEAVMAASM